MTRSKIPTARVEFDEAIDLRTTHSGSNRRHVLTIDGVTRNLREWEHVSGIPRNVIRHRLNRGWEPRAAVFTDTTADAAGRERRAKAVARLPVVCRGVSMFPMGSVRSFPMFALDLLRRIA